MGYDSGILRSDNYTVEKRSKAVKYCSCPQPKSDGHDWSCRNHPRFKKRKRITDTVRLNFLLTPEADPVYLTSRRTIDAAIRASWGKR